MANKVSYIRYNQPYTSSFNPNMQFQLVIKSYDSKDRVGTNNIYSCINGAIDGIDVGCDKLSSGTDVSQTLHCVLRARGSRYVSGYDYHMVESLANACDSLGIADVRLTFKDANDTNVILEQKFTKMANSRTINTKTYLNGKLFDDRDTYLTYTQTAYGDDNAISNYSAYLPSTYAFSTKISDSVIKAVKTNNFSGLVKLPSNLTSTYTTSKTRKTYYRRVVFAQTDTETSYSVQWGTSSGSYTNTFITRKMVFNQDNYNTASNLLSTSANADLSDLGKYLEGLEGSPTIKKTPVYGVIANYHLAILSSDNTLRSYGPDRKLVTEDTNVIGTLGCGGNTTLYQYLYRNPVNLLSLSTDGGNSRMDCFRAELPVFLNIQEKKLSGIKAEGYDIPILCVATGHVKKTYLIVAMNGDIYGGTTSTDIIKIGHLEGAYRAIIDCDENRNELYFILDTDNTMYRISSATLEFKILGTYYGVQDVLYNSTTYFGGPGIAILTVDNQIYILDTDTLRIRSLQSASAALLIHDINPDYTRDFGYIDTSGNIHTYGAYGNNPKWNDVYYTPMASPNMKMIPTVPNTIVGQYNSLNGLLYHYKIIFSFNSTQLVYTVHYGTTENYGDVYTIVTMNVDPTLYNTITNLAVSDATAKLDQLKNHLNAIIGTVNLPSDKITNYTTKSGKVIKIETKYTQDSITQDKAVITYTTAYSGDSFNTIYKTGVHTIVPDNYKTYSADLAKYASTHANEIVKNKLGLWNVEVPDDELIEWTNKGKITYYFYIRYTQGQTSDTSNSINYEISYGKTRATATENLSVRGYHAFDVDNYLVATNTLTTKITSAIAEIQADLDIPNITPKATTTELYQSNEFEYELSVVHTKNDAINKVTTTAYIDNTQYGDAIETEFYEQSEADKKMVSLTSSLMGEMKSKCTSPSNYTETVKVGNCQFTIETKYSKAQGVKMGYARIYLDGELYTTETVSITANSIEENLTSIKAIAEDKFRKLRDLIQTFPTNATDKLSISNMNFSLAFELTKYAGDKSLQYRVICDNVAFHEGVIELAAQTISTSIESLSTMKTSEIASLKQYITTNIPLESGDVIAMNDLKFYVGCTYSKDAGSNTVYVSGVRDGNIYSTAQVETSILTLEKDKADMIMAANSIKASIRDEIEEHPLPNSNLNHVVNGFGYFIRTSYYKQSGDNTVAIMVDLDGLSYYTTNFTINPSDLGASLDLVKSTGNLVTEGLIAILDSSPANNEYDDYIVDGFIYHIGTTYSKRLSSHDVLVNIYIDGKIQDTFTETIEASTLADDMNRLKATVDNKVTVFKSDLIGIKTITELFSKNSFDYNIRALFEKNIKDNTITISTTVDNINYGNSLTVPFIKEDIPKYRAEGQKMIDDIRNYLAEVTPTINPIIYSVYNFYFNISATLTKTYDDSNVLVYLILDGNAVGAPETITFDIKNPLSIQANVFSLMDTIKRKLTYVPTDESTNVTMNSFRFNIAHKFTKEESSNYVKIKILLDGKLYKELTEIFDPDDLERLNTIVTTEEESLRSKLREAPRDFDLTWTFGTFGFYVEALFSKQENSNIIKSVLKIDGAQYGETHIEQFDINNMESIGSFIIDYIDTVKLRYQSLVPADVHTTYSRNGYNFAVDILMSKQPGTDVVDISYTIDNLDKDTEAVTVTLTDSMSTIINNQS